MVICGWCRCKQKDAGIQRKPRQMSIQRHESVMSRELSDSLQRKKPNSLERWTHNEPKKCEIPRRETKHEQSSIHQMEKMRSQWFMEKQSWTVNDDKVMQRSLQWSRRWCHAFVGGAVLWHTTAWCVFVLPSPSLHFRGCLKALQSEGWRGGV